MLTPAVVASAEAAADAATTDPRMLALIELVERLAGRRVRVIKQSDLDPRIDEAAMAQIAKAAPAVQAERSGGPPPRAGWGVSVDIHAESATTATLDFSARCPRARHADERAGGSQCPQRVRDYI